jgi:outer membrane autotransporter protein
VTDSSGPAQTVTGATVGGTISAAVAALTLTPTPSTQLQVGQPYSQTNVAAGGTGPYTYALANGTLPAGLSLDPATGTVSGTPTTAGAFSYAIKATDSSAPQQSATGSTVSGTITAAVAVLTITPNSGPATGGTSVTITGTGFTGVTAVSFGGVAATGIAVHSDTIITAPTPTHAAGAATVMVTVPSGDASLPNGFTYAPPAPTVASHTLQFLAGTSATVDLTQGATGGPFTAASIVTPPPASDGTASIARDGSQWHLTYVSTPDAASTVVIRYTLSNASGTSAPGTVTFTVIARPDPSRDPEVIGLLNAQAQSAQQFAKAQITNFRDRLEQLHDDSSREATSMNVRLGIPQDPNDPNALGYAQETRPYDPTRGAFAYAPDDAGIAKRLSDETPPPTNGSPSDLAFWAGGFVNFGTSNKYNIDLGHTLIGVSGGVDYRFSPSFIAGIGLGYGRDMVDVGTNGTHSNGQAFSGAIYGSYHPDNHIFVDGLLGYSALDFDSKRFVAPTSGFADGNRSGSQVFGSLSGGYEYKGSDFLVSPYGRIEAAWTQLDAFAESGAVPYNLAVGDQTMDMLAGVLGLRTEYVFPQDWGSFKARGRLEYTHDFSGSSWASMGYADLGNGLPYSLNIDAFTKDYVAVGLGFDASVGNGAMLGFDYTTAFGFDGNSQTHNFALRLSEKF